MTADDDGRAGLKRSPAPVRVNKRDRDNEDTGEEPERKKRAAKSRGVK